MGDPSPRAAALLAELKRRKVHRAAAWYVAAAAGAWGAVEVAGEALGLPDVVLQVVVVASLVGFPVVLLLAWFFEVRLEDDAPAEPEASGAPVRRRWGLVGVGVAGVAAVTAAFVLAGPRGLRGSVLEEGAHVLVADFQSSVGDEDAALGLRQLAHTGLSRSAHLRIVPDASVASALVRMRLDPSDPVTPSLAREVAVRDGFEATLEGSVVRVGDGWLVSLSLVDAGSQRVLLTDSEPAPARKELVPAMARLVERVRAGLGESLASMKSEPPLETVTTPSLEALSAYSRGMGALVGRGGQAGVEFREALAADSLFAIAHMMLGQALRSGGAFDDAAAATTRAYELRERATRLERLAIEGAYHELVTRDLAASRAAFSAGATEVGGEALTLDALGTLLPGSYNMLAVLAVAEHAFERAEALVLEAGALRGGFGTNEYWNLAALQFKLGKDADLETTLAAWDRDFGPGASFAARTRIAWQRGEWVRMEAVLDSMLALYPAAANLLGIGAVLDVTRGRVAAGTRQLRQMGGGIERLPEGDAIPELYLAHVALEAYGDSAAVLERVRGIAREVAAEIPEEPHVALWIGGLLGEAGDGAAGRAYLGAFDSLATPFDRARFGRERLLAEGRVLSGEGRTAEAVEMLRRADAHPTFPFACELCPVTVLGRAFDAAGRPDSAIAYLEKHQNGRWIFGPVRPWNAAYLAGTLERLGRLYEATGDTARAVARYRQFIDQWEDADPELQPRVRAAREALERLRAPGGAP